MDKALCLRLMSFLSDKMKEEGHPPDPNELGRRYSRIERNHICPLADECSNYAKVLEAFGAIQLELSLDVRACELRAKKLEGYVDQKRNI